MHVEFSFRYLVSSKTKTIDLPRREVLVNLRFTGSFETAGLNVHFVAITWRVGTGRNKEIHQ